MCLDSYCYYYYLLCFGILFSCQQNLSSQQSSALMWTCFASLSELGNKLKKNKKMKDLISIVTLMVSGFLDLGCRPLSWSCKFQHSSDGQDKEESSNSLRLEPIFRTQIGDRSYTQKKKKKVGHGRPLKSLFPP